MVKFLRAVVISITMAFAGLLVIELGLFSLGIDAQSPSQSFQMEVAGELLGEYDPVRFWRLKSVEPVYSEDSRRVMCLTDSVAVMYEGKGYPEILSKQLQQSHPDQDIEIFNGGVPGYTSFQGFKYLFHELISYQPELIILCYGWNDHWYSNNGLPDKAQRPQKAGLLSQLDFLRSVRLIHARVLAKQQRGYQATSGSTLRVSLQDYRANLEQIIKRCEIEGIHVVMMTAPYYQLETELEQLHNEYNDVVRELSTRYQLPLVDLIHEFKDREDLFIEPDTDPVHYNWQGSEIVARALLPKVVPLLVTE